MWASEDQLRSLRAFLASEARFITMRAVVSLALPTAVLSARVQSRVRRDLNASSSGVKKEEQPEKEEWPTRRRERNLAGAQSAQPWPDQLRAAARIHPKRMDIRACFKTLLVQPSGLYIFCNEAPMISRIGLLQRGSQLDQNDRQDLKR